MSRGLVERKTCSLIHYGIIICQFTECRDLQNWWKFGSGKTTGIGHGVHGCWSIIGHKATCLHRFGWLGQYRPVLRRRVQLQWLSTLQAQNRGESGLASIYPKLPQNFKKLGCPTRSRSRFVKKSGWPSRSQSGPNPILVEILPPSRYLAHSCSASICQYSFFLIALKQANKMLLKFLLFYSMQF